MNIWMRRLLLLSSAAAVCGAGVAGTVIEMRYGESDRGTISIDGNWARADRSLSPQRYLLANLQTGEVYTIHAKRREIAVLPREDVAAPDSVVPPDSGVPMGAALKKVGQGPLIGGLPTEHYQVRIAARVCGDVYIAPEIDNKDFQRFEKAMSNYTHAMNRQMLARAVGKGMTADVCDVAALAIEPEVLKLGRVMRYGRDGRISMEVLEIREKDGLEVERLRLPEDYRKVDLLPPLVSQNAIGKKVVE